MSEVRGIVGTQSGSFLHCAGLQGMVLRGDLPSRNGLTLPGGSFVLLASQGWGSEEAGPRTGTSKASIPRLSSDFCGNPWRLPDLPQPFLCLPEYLTVTIQVSFLPLHQPQQWVQVGGTSVRCSLANLRHVAASLGCRRNLLHLLLSLSFQPRWALASEGCTGSYVTTHRALGAHLWPLWSDQFLGEGSGVKDPFHHGQGGWGMHLPIHASDPGSTDGPVFQQPCLRHVLGVQS